MIQWCPLRVVLFNYSMRIYASICLLIPLQITLYHSFVCLEVCLEVKSKSYKVRKLEKNRFSVFTDDLEHCFYCGMPRSDLHELLFGTNRNNSMILGFVLPLCHAHHQLLHSDARLIDYWHKECQKYFESEHSRDEFISIFHRNYLD